MNAFRFWQIGGVGGGSYASISLVLPFLVVGALICAASARGLNSLALGEEVAAGLGERVATTRLVAAGGAVLLCGASTAVAGPIAFVGLVVPHLCRLLVGIDHRWLLPFSMLVGASLLTAADVIGRVVARPVGGGRRHRHRARRRPVLHLHRAPAEGAGPVTTLDRRRPRPETPAQAGAG